MRDVQRQIGRILTGDVCGGSRRLISLTQTQSSDGQVHMITITLVYSYGDD